jgi:uncharacterized Zn finger protein (UPF0148 family)
MYRNATENCPDCGGPLACFEGEHYCPDCTRYEVEREAQQATAEAVLLRQAEAEMAAADDGPAGGEGPPY